ncbi:helix-turn-helix domain-containing protein [Pontibacter sp. G13]|uniref:helix-turn-helix domain-containing protein n=1 Tax=Pontibacter sp. G13 TaxID=3074898 RepID=UPI002889280E|nr:helix-turn-helix domain-containing protein [Pontibacter sp. G13]WNJ17692.1 helix-turn-helix domain-containing protein [Pontibacter sp. G13]
MEPYPIQLPPDLAPYVNCVFFERNDTEGAQRLLKLYADGYPGIMYQQAVDGCVLLPANKRLSTLFLYGQTIDPVSLDIRGAYHFVVFQLYPFASKYLLGVDPRQLNDDCYDLCQLEYLDPPEILLQLSKRTQPNEQIDTLCEMMRAMIQHEHLRQHEQISQAIRLIIRAKGQVEMRTVQDAVAMTPRTFERNFMAEVGLSPKQFAKIIQFQTSLRSLTETQFSKLTDVGIDSGFADQSHFIRTFKRYTGATPRQFLNGFASG